ncbi:MAG: hypothetical protein O3C51_10575 [Planctomycetota bacterium]|nr:hypothetical protein [Planctomycetota bacterium]
MPDTIPAGPGTLLEPTPARTTGPTLVELMRSAPVGSVDIGPVGNWTEGVRADDAAIADLAAGLELRREVAANRPIASWAALVLVVAVSIASGLVAWMPAPTAGPGPLVARPPLALPDPVRYEAALELAAAGAFRDARRELEGVLAAGVDPRIAHLIHAQLAHYSARDGAFGDALVHERAALDLGDQERFPRGLVEAAVAAQASGDAPAMRAAYAQFLTGSGRVAPAFADLLDEALGGPGNGVR